MLKKALAASGARAGQCVMLLGVRGGGLKSQFYRGSRDQLRPLGIKTVQLRLRESRNKRTQVMNLGKTS